MNHRVKAHTVTISHDDHIFTLVYGIHVRTQDPEDIPTDTSAVFLETGVHDYLSNPQQTIEHFRKHPQYKELLTYFEEKRIPILLGDVRFRFNDILLLLVDNIIPVTEWYMGQKLLKKKGLRGGKAFILSTWLMLPFATNVMRLISSVTGKGQEATSRLKRLSHSLHPEAEVLYLTLRNAVIAEKLIYTASFLGKNSHITAVLGAGHVGIEDMLEVSDRKRKGTLRMLQPLMRYVAKPAYISSVVLMTYTGNEWVEENRLVVPELTFISD